MMPAIRFLRNEANKVEGLQYAGFETFRGSPYTSCARETGQNSRDASSGQGPVVVSFDLLRLKREEVPFADELEHAIDCCLSAPHDEKTKAHLERARQGIASPIIKVLRISDLNTTGLTGPVDDPESVFTALVKGDGVTIKADPTSAGSYGIGKNAAYAVSDLQTVVYSTRYKSKNTSKTKFAAQGRLRLISHVDGAEKFSAEGYWGNESFTAIESESEVPSWIARSEIGTSIFAVGFREQDNWVGRMTLSLAANFFLAIDRRDIDFSLESGAVVLNQSSLDGILDSAGLKEVADDNDQTLELDRAKRLMRCIRSDAAERHVIKVEGLGEFVLHLLVEEGLPREVHVLRNGIYICDNFSKFGLPLKRFPGTREFIAVLEPMTGPTGNGASQLLKQLENPAHDAFEPERIVDASLRQTAKLQIKSLISNVREIIRSVAKIEDIDQSQLEELSHLFASGGGDTVEDSQESEADPDRFKYGTARKSPHAKPPAAGAKGGARRRRGSIKERTKIIHGEKTKPNVHPPTGAKAIVALRDVRSVMPGDGSAQVRTIYFTPDVGGEVDILVSASGLSGDVELALSSTSEGRVVKNKIRTTVLAEERTHIDISFSDPFAGPIELSANAVVESSESGEETK